MLEYKNENFTILYSLITKGVTVQDFLEGYINSYLDHFQRFRFFVLADSYYNYHRQYDLTDSVIMQYDTDTRKNGELILKCLTNDMTKDQLEKTRVGISMIIGFLRRYAMIPQKSWPRNEDERKKMIDDFMNLSFLVFQDIGFKMDSIVMIPEEEGRQIMGSDPI